MHVVATAGHVDHGKSSLVRALTGTDPDRLIEEKTRGLTIDLGFAHTRLPSGQSVDFVDVPGHTRFIANMLAGVGAVDACLFVVAATDGWKPQSEEHLRILELLGVNSGIIALTKTDLVDAEHEQLTRLDLEDRFTGTFLEGVEPLSVALPLNEGVDELRASLDRVLETTASAPDLDRPRLWIDRSFSLAGTGTVVTGTLTGGSISLGDELRISGPLAPSGLPVRVRALETHGERHEKVGPGRRLAVNLSGVGHREVTRGSALTRPNQWHLSDSVDVSLSILGSLDHPVSARGAFKAYFGCGEYPVGLRMIRTRHLQPGESGYARIRLPIGLPLLPGDRYVLRESGRSETIGGGEILDVAPVLPVSKAQPSRSIERVVAERRWTDIDELERLTGKRLAATVGARWVVDPAVVDATRVRLLELVDKAGAFGLDIAALDDRERLVLEETSEIVLRNGRAYSSATPDGVPTELLENPWRHTLEENLFSPPQPGEFGVGADVVRALVRHRLVVVCGGIHFSPRAITRTAEEVAALLADSPTGITVSAVRERLDTTRKFMLPLLAELDATGVTRRRGDLRIAGPRIGPRGAT